MSTPAVPKARVGLATASDELALIYKQNFRTLLAFARSKRVDDPEDIVHESILKAAEKVNLAELSLPASYLTLVTQRTIIGRRRRQATADRHVRLNYRAADNVESAEEAAESDDQARQLKAALASLPERQRLLLTLQSEGMSPIEIADFLSTDDTKVTANQVSSSISRGRKTVRRRLLKEGFVPAFLPGLNWIKEIRRRILSRLTPVAGEAGMLVQTLLAGALVIQLAIAPNSPSPTVATGGASPAASVADSASVNTRAHKVVVPKPREGPPPLVGSVGVAKTEIVGVSFVDDRAPPPSFQEQVEDFAAHPEKAIPLPTCTGLPICR